MTRNPRAGHPGAVGRRPRCPDCGHRRGPRVVTRTTKTAGKDESLAVPRFHKKPCACVCHGVVPSMDLEVG